MFDHHDRGVGHVHADFDHRGGDEDRQAAVGEVGHDGLALGARHLAMSQADLEAQQASQIAGAIDGGRQVDGLGFLNQRADPIGLGAAFDGGLQAGGDLTDAGQGQDGGCDGGAAGRFLHQATDLQLAVLR